MACFGAAAVCLLALTGCGALGAATATESPPTIIYPTYAPIPTATPNPAVLVQQTIVQFCQALSDSNFSQAYSYLSPSYQHRVGSPSALPKVLERTWGKTLGCIEFGNGGFIQISGDHAQDNVSFTVYLTAFGKQQNIGSTVVLVQAGTAWQIDSNS
jgi:hypothetical protein